VKLFKLPHRGTLHKQDQQI